MRLSTDGQHVLSTASGVYLDGTLVAPNTVFGDFLTNAITFYGGFNGPVERLGRYVSPLAPLAPQYLAPDFVSTIQQFWTDGASRWLLRAADGAHDSDGNFWPDRYALGASRQGDWVFASMPDFKRMLVRNAAGVESPYDFGAFFDFGGMDHDLICVQPQNRPVRILGLSSPVQLPNAMALAVSPFQVWCAGYASGYGLCLARASQTPLGYLLSGDGHDFGPAIAIRNDGMIVVASGATQAEYPQRVYLVDPNDMTCSLNGSPRWTLQPVDLMNPPQPSVPRFDHPTYVGSFFSSR